MGVQNREYLVESITESIDSIKIMFYDYIIFQHEVLINILNELNDPNHNVELVKVITEYSKYKVEGGYQNTFHGWVKPKNENAITYSAKNYSPPLDDGWLVSEIFFKYQIFNKIFNIHFYGKHMVITPKLSKNDLNNILSKIKQNVFNIQKVTLLTAKEFLNSAIGDFISGRYRSSSHNIYYSLYNLIKSTQTDDDILNLNLRHVRDLKLLLNNLFTQIETEQHPIFKFDKDAILFKELPFESYIKLLDDAYDLRRKADYKIEFLAGVFSQDLYNVITRVDQLFQIINYLNGPSIFKYSNELALHTPFFGYLAKCPVEKLTVDDEIIVFSALIISSKYNTPAIIKELLKNEKILCTHWHYLDSDSTLYGRVIKQDDGYLTSITYKPEKDSIPLTLENSVKWSEKYKPVKLFYLEENNEDNDLKFIFMKIPFTLELFSDGRIYLLTDKQNLNLLKNWEVIQNFIIIFYSTINDLFAPQFRIIFNHFPFEVDIFEYYQN